MKYSYEGNEVIVAQATHETLHALYKELGQLFPNLEKHDTYLLLPDTFIISIGDFVTLNAETFDAQAPQESLLETVNIFTAEEFYKTVTPVGTYTLEEIMPFVKYRDVSFNEHLFNTEIFNENKWRVM